MAKLVQCYEMMKTGMCSNTATPRCSHSRPHKWKKGSCIKPYRIEKGVVIPTDCTCVPVELKVDKSWWF